MVRGTLTYMSAPAHAVAAREPAPTAPRRSRWVVRALRGEALVFRALLHAFAALALALTAAGAMVAEPYFTRGVATGAAWNPIPYTGGNPMGVNTFLNEEPDPAVVDRSLQMIADGGFGYVRQVFGWYEIEPRRGQFDWAKYDRIVAGADRYGLQVIARLEKPPAWARPAGADLTLDGPPDQLQDYADFVAAVVARYQGRVTFFQLWNEPNLRGEWGGRPIDPRGYVDLLEAGYRAAKRANPDAVILLAGLAPNDQTGPDNLSDLLFLQRVYDFGGAAYFDIATVMVYGYGYPPSDRRVDFGRNNFSRPIQTREIMLRNGDAGTPVWAVEYGWVSLPAGWQGRPSPWGEPVSAERQADYLVDGYLRAQREWPWMGMMAVWAFRFPRPATDPNEVGNPTRGFALVEHDFTPRPAYTALAANADRIRRAGTGSRPLSELESAHLAIGDPITLRVVGRRVDLVVQGAGQVELNIDGNAARPYAFDTGAGPPRQFTIADGLSDGPHDIELFLLDPVPQGATQPVLGYVVVRDPWQLRVYPWARGALLAVLALLTASTVWLLWDVRRLRSARSEPRG